MTTPCTTCKGTCPTPEACHMPIQPGPGEIQRDRLDYALHITSRAAMVAGAVVIALVAGYALVRFG